MHIAFALRHNEGDKRSGASLPNLLIVSLLFPNTNAQHNYSNLVTVERFAVLLPPLSCAS